jgi:hypothetical protein
MEVHLGWAAAHGEKTLRPSSSVSCKRTRIAGPTATARLLRGKSDDDASRAAFQPLDMWAEGHAGCVEIQYLDGDTWETL